MSGPLKEVWVVLCQEDGQPEEVEILFTTEAMARQYQHDAIAANPGYYYYVENWIVNDTY